MTDIHLNFLTRPKVIAFLRKVFESYPDAVFLCGDIGDARSVAHHLKLFETIVQCPTYFVLGNHDYYHGSIDGVRAEMGKVLAGSRLLHWMPRAGIVALSEHVSLLGCESWADGRYGDYAGSGVVLNDYVYIKDLAGLSAAARLDRLHALADAAAAELEKLLPQALERSRSVILLTHVPPFEEACRYQGRRTDPKWLPHFSCKAMGDVIRNVMSEYSNHKMMILCGHTHDPVTVRVLPNVEVIAGGAVYGSPKVQGVLTINGCVHIGDG